MRKKLLIAVPLLVVVIAAMGAYKVLSPTPVVPKAKVDGDVYVLPREFLINLDAGRYASSASRWFCRTITAAPRPNPLKPESHRRATGRYLRRLSSERS